MHHARPRRLVALALAAALTGSILAAAGAGPAAAATVKPIVFPVDGAVTYTRDFGAPRSGGRTHEGNDLMGQKMMPELAAVDGTVFRLTFNNLSTGGNSVTIKGDDGWTYHYIHVNNDTPGTDNGAATREQAFPSNIVVGARVTRGQVVAYMGDSGNAESTAPHLHFEIRQPAAAGQYTGAAIDPYDSLQAATRWSTVQRWELRRTPTAGPVEDVVSYGLQIGDRALLCDWDGDGLDEAVVFRGGEWHLRNGTTTGATASRVVFGSRSDVAMCGNVDADAADEPILFNNGTWTFRSGFDAADPVAHTARYGVSPGDVPVLGDWDADGRDDLAIYRAGGSWSIRNGSGPTGRTLYTFTYGVQSGDRPVAGDWDGNGTDDAGIYRKGQWHLRSTASPTGSTVRSFLFGAANDLPLAGRWGTPAASGLGVMRPRTA